MGAVFPTIVSVVSPFRPRKRKKTFDLKDSRSNTPKQDLDLLSVQKYAELKAIDMI